MVLALSGRRMEGLRKKSPGEAANVTPRWPVPGVCVLLAVPGVARPLSHNVPAVTQHRHRDNCGLASKEAFVLRHRVSR